MGKRNPNGYGSVTHLKGHRSRPFMVRVTVYDDDGNHRQKAVGYAESREKAMLLLAEYNQNPWEIDRDSITLYGLYQKWLEVKCPFLGKANQGKLKAAFKYCKPCYGMKYRSIKSYHMQKCIDDCPRGYQTKSAIQTLFTHLDKFAFEIDVISKMYSQIITVRETAPVTKRTAFTKEQIDRMWEMSDDRNVQIILIYLYSGFRRDELLTMKKFQVDLQQKTFTGGEKTSSGKNRVVPIHSRIELFVTKFMSEESDYLIHNECGKRFSHTGFYALWSETMNKLGIEGKTLHETRHTFETMLDNAGGNRRCIDLLMGHKSKDIGNRVYNHKTLDQLRETIELLH